MLALEGTLNTRILILDNLVAKHCPGGRCGVSNGTNSHCVLSTWTKSRKPGMLNLDF